MRKELGRREVEMSNIGRKIRIDKKMEG